MWKMFIVFGIIFMMMCFAILSLSCPESRAEAEKTKTYVGSNECKDCHEIEYGNFKSYAKKARSYESVKRMEKGLTYQEYQKCLDCHTTAHGKPGGFLSERETPHLKNAGCEVCHGPGSIHIETEDSDDIKARLTVEDCEACHNSERVEAFNYKPMIYGGAH